MGNYLEITFRRLVTKNDLKTATLLIRRVRSDGSGGNVKATPKYEPNLLTNLSEN